VLDWTLDLFFSRDLVQLAVKREQREADGVRSALDSR
jgi:hypothetical protein